MFLTPEELKTHLYTENIDIISRNDVTILQAAIDGAIQESKSYLSSYDRDSIFSASGDARNALLLIFIKDMSVWHFINLCNAGTEMEIRKARYDRAVDWHKAVQKGQVSPDLPVIIDDKGDSSAGQVIYGSNVKRNQHF